jgi:halocyanin-like protein
MNQRDAGDARRTADPEDGARRSRRGFLRATTAGATAVGVGAAASGTAGAEQAGDFDGWLEDDDSYEGDLVDETGSDSVTVAVGVDGNDGTNAFDPSAVQVDPGTTVVWEWTGDGFHNVVAESGADFESETTDSAGFTFEHVFEEEGVVKYYCGPHQGLGMKGVVVVGDPDLGGGAGGGSDGHGSEGGLVLTPELAAVGGALVLGVLSPIAFAIHLLVNRDAVDRPQPTSDGRADGNLRRIDSGRDD